MQSTVFTSDHQLRSIQVSSSHFTDVLAWQLTLWILMVAVNEYCALFTRSCCLAVSVIVRHLECWSNFPWSPGLDFPETEICQTHTTFAKKKASKHCHCLGAWEWQQIQGKTSKTWQTTFKEDLKTMKLAWRGAKRFASDHSQWRTIVD